MNYTQEMFEEDKKLVLFAFSKSTFSKNKLLSGYFDDFINYALMYATRCRKLYVDCKGAKYSTYAIKTFKRAFISCYKRLKMKHTFNTISLNMPSIEDSNTEMQDCIAENNQSLLSGLIFKDMQCLLEYAKKLALINENGKKRNTKNLSEIIDAVIKGDCKYASIASKFGLSREFVRVEATRFKMIYARLLVKYGFCTKNYFIDVDFVTPLNFMLSCDVEKLKNALRKNNVKYSKNCRFYKTMSYKGLKEICNNFNLNIFDFAKIVSL